MDTGPSSPPPPPPTLTPRPADPLLFSQHREKMAPGIYKALTGHPFRYETMSTVQEAILAQHPWDHDYLVKSKTGTGKTLAFLIPAVERRLKQLALASPESGVGADESRSRSRFSSAPRSNNPSGAGVLILSPTRELAKQIAEEASKLVSNHREWSIGCFVGGEDRRRQLRAVERRADIIVGTPGRVYDLMTSDPKIERYLKSVQTLIFDEADTLLDMGFRDQMTEIVDRVAPLQDRSTFMFSATISREVRTIAMEMLKPDYKYMDLVGKDEVNLHAHVPQSFSVIEPTTMVAHIMKLIEEEQLANPKAKIIVFFNTTKMTQLVAKVCFQLRETLSNPRCNISTLTGAMSQEARTRVSNRFRENPYAAVLFTTDVSARGIDYPNVTRVIQVGAPANLDSYIHRTGRTGRAGRQGQGNLLLFPFEKGFVKRVLSKVPLTEDAMDAAALDEWTSKNQIAIDRAMDQASDEEAEEAFVSALGYYVSKASNLGTTNERVLEDLKAVLGAGLQCREPTVSPAFLARIGAAPSNARRPYFAQREGGGGRSSFASRYDRGGGGGGRGYDRQRSDFDSGETRPRYGGGYGRSARAAGSGFRDYGRGRYDQSSGGGDRNGSRDRYSNLNAFDD